MNGSLWWDTLPSSLHTSSMRPPLGADTFCDVAIVGAGFTGLWTAYYLKQSSPDCRIVVIDANEAGFGASGRNGGWCSALFPSSLESMAKNHGRSEAIRMIRTMHDTIDEIFRVSSDHGLDIGWAKGGTTILARSPLQWARSQQEISQWRSWGFAEDDHTLLSAPEARALVGATDVLGGTFTPHCASLNPALLVRNLARVVEALGVTIHEHTAAERIEPGIVRTAHGSIRSEFIVRATEGYTSSLPGLRRTLAPIYSLMVATEPLPESVWKTINLSSRTTFSDERRLIIYGQRTADNRLAFGGRGAAYHFGSRTKPDYDRSGRVFMHLKRALVDMFPDIAPYGFTHEWGGPLGAPRDWHPSCGLDLTTGIAWSGGYIGDGVATSNLGGRTVADLILGRETDLTTLPWVNHRSPRWEPEPLRWLGVNAGLGAMAFGDTSESSTGRPSRTAGMIDRFLKN